MKAVLSWIADYAAHILLFIVLIGIMAMFAFVFQDSRTGTVRVYPGEVMQLVYTPSSHSSGVGIGLNSKGGVVPVVVSSSEEEHWTVVVKFNGKIETMSVSPETYYTQAVGSKINVYCKTTQYLKRTACALQ